MHEKLLKITQRRSLRNEESTLLKRLIALRYSAKGIDFLTIKSLILRSRVSSFGSPFRKVFLNIVSLSSLSFSLNS